MELYAFVQLGIIISPTFSRHTFYQFYFFFKPGQSYYIIKTLLHYKINKILIQNGY